MKLTCLLTSASLLLLAGICNAQVVAVAPNPATTTSAPAEYPPKVPKVIKINTQAKAAPRNALAVQFVYSADELEEGNAALLLYQALLQAQAADKDQKWSYKVAEDLDLQLSQLPFKEVEARWQVYKNALHLMELASKKKTCDWGFAYTDGEAMIIPPLSSLRNMSRALALKVKIHLARKEYDQAMEGIRQGLTFARQVGDGPSTLISGLVGMAQADHMLREVQEAMEQPEAINMYWALASLPEPLIDLRTTWGFERNWIYQTFPAMKNIRSRQMTPQQWGELLTAIIEKTRAWGGSGDMPPALMAMQIYPKARLYLKDQGMTVKEIDAMSVSQAILIYMIEEYEHWRDEAFKWHSLPYAQARQGLETFDTEFQGVYGRGAYMNPLLSTLPTLGRVSFLQARLDRSVAALRTIEAIRIYAADKGKLPQSLDEMKDAPAALDPTTGKAFSYKVEGNHFTLSSLGAKELQDNVVYEVTVEMKSVNSAATATGK